MLGQEREHDGRSSMEMSGGRQDGCTGRREQNTLFRSECPGTHNTLQVGSDRRLVNRTGRRKIASGSIGKR